MGLGGKKVFSGEMKACGWWMVDDELMGGGRSDQSIGLEIHVVLCLVLNTLTEILLWSRQRQKDLALLYRLAKWACRDQSTSG